MDSRPKGLLKSLLWLDLFVQLQLQGSPRGGDGRSGGRGGWLHSALSVCLPEVPWDRGLLSCSSTEEGVEAKNILATCPHLFAQLVRRKLGLEPNTGLLAWNLNCLKASVPSVRCVRFLEPCCWNPTLQVWTLGSCWGHATLSTHCWTVLEHRFS